MGKFDLAKIESILEEVKNRCVKVEIGLEESTQRIDYMLDEFKEILSSLRTVSEAVIKLQLMHTNDKIRSKSEDVCH